MSDSDKPVAFCAAVKQPDGAIIWTLFDTEAEALAADYRSELGSTNDSLQKANDALGGTIETLTNNMNAARDYMERQAADYTKVVRDLQGQIQTLIKALGKVMT